MLISRVTKIISMIKNLSLLAMRKSIGWVLLRLSEQIHDILNNSTLPDKIESILNMIGHQP